MPFSLWCTLIKALKLPLQQFWFIRRNSRIQLTELWTSKMTIFGPYVRISYLTVAKSPRLHSLDYTTHSPLTHHVTWRCWRRIKSNSSSGNSKFAFGLDTLFLSWRHTALPWFLLILKQKRNNWRRLLPYRCIRHCSSVFWLCSSNRLCVTVLAAMYCPTVRGTRNSGLLVDISYVCWLWAV